MKISVHPLAGTTCPLLSLATVSNVRIEVVPTAMTRLPAFLVASIMSAVSFDTL